MGRITVKDIAKLLRINPSTVSRALNDHPDISPETRERVKQIADDLGYTPNQQAISFRRRKSRLIALIIPDMNMFFFPAVIRAIEQRVRREGYNLIVLHSNNSLRGEQENIKICLQLGVEGLLISLSGESRDLHHFEEIAEKEIPMVFFDRVLEELPFPSVAIDDAGVAYQIAAYLKQQGRTRLCGLFGDPSLSISRRRKEGFIRAIDDLGLGRREEWMINAIDLSSAREGLIAILNEKERPDAVFTMSDELLVGAMQALLSKGVDIPGQMAVMTISNGELPRFWNPPITYMEHSGSEVGATAAQTLFHIIQYHHPEALHKLISTRLIEQRSV